MGKNKEISQPSETDMPSVSQRAKEKTKDFATGWHIQTEENEHKVQAESSQDHAPSDTNPHSEGQMSNEGQRDEVTHPESRLRNASGNEIEGKVLWLGQNTREMEKFLQERYESAKQEAILYGEQEIPASEANLAEHNESIENSGNKTSKLERTIEDFDDKMYNSWIKAIGYEGVYLDLEKECSFIEAKISHLEEKLVVSNKECKSLENEINDLNIKIETKEQNKKELLSKHNKLITKQDKKQEEHYSLREEVETQADSQSKKLKDLKSQIRNMKERQSELQKDLRKYVEEIANKNKEKEFFNNESKNLKAIVKPLEQHSQEMRAKERDQVELQKKIKVTERSILDNQEWINHLRHMSNQPDNVDLVREQNCQAESPTFDACIKEKVEELSNPKESFDNGSLNDLNEELKATESLLDSITKKTNSKISDLEKAMEEQSSIPYYERIIPVFSSKMKTLSEKCNRLEAEKEFLSNLSKLLSKLTAYYNDEINDETSLKAKANFYYDDGLESIKQEIFITENRLKEHQEEINKYNQNLNEKISLTKDLPTNSIDGQNISKADELTPFREPLKVIKKYGKDNDVKKYFLLLQDKKQELQHIEIRIEELENDNWRNEQNIVHSQFKHELYLKGRETTILAYKLENENFQPSKNANSYKGQNLESLKMVRDRILKSINKLDDKVLKTTQNTNNIMNLSDDLLNDLKSLRETISTGISRDEYFADFSRNDYNSLLDKYNSLLTKYINDSDQFKQELYNSVKNIMQAKDEIERHELDIIVIDKIIYNYKLKEIEAYKEAYRSELEAYQTGISDLKGKISPELRKISTQFDTDLQNLQRSHDEKKSEIESLQSKLATLRNSMQQETKRQELPGQSDRLNSRAKTTRPTAVRQSLDPSERRKAQEDTGINPSDDRRKIETITRELEDHHKKLEESCKALAAAKQENRLLETRIEQFKKELEEKEEQCKHAQSENKKWMDSFIDAHGAIEEALVNKSQQETDLAKVEEEKKSREEECKNTQKGFKHLKEPMKNRIQLPEEYRFIADEPTRKALEALVQAQDEVKTAQTKLSHARRDVSKAVITTGTPDDADEPTHKALEALVQAQDEVKTARTKLSHARRDVSEAVTTTGTPDDANELTRTLEAFVQAQDEVKTAQTKLLNAWRDTSEAVITTDDADELTRTLEAFVQAQYEVKTARTKLLNARRDISDAVITMARPDDEDRMQMLEAKFETILHKKDWRRQWITKQH